MNGIFYGVGVGPGDPEQVTLKAVNIIKKADVIFAPKTEKNNESIALNIVREYLSDSSEIIIQTFPMTNEKMKKEKAWKKNKNEILNYLKKGKKAVFLTLGDPMLYSTYIYILKLLKKDKYPVITIPGIPSFCDIASKCSIALAEGEEILRIIPATACESRLEEAINSKDNIVLIKVYRNKEFIISKLVKAKNIDELVMINNSGLPDQEIFTDINEIKNKNKINYLSTLIIKKKNKKPQKYTDYHKKRYNS